MYLNQWNEKPEYLIEIDEVLQYRIRGMPDVFPTLIFSLSLITIIQLFILLGTSKKTVRSFDALADQLDHTYSQLITDWENQQHYKQVAFDRFSVANRFVYQDKDTYEQIRLENSKMYEESKKLVEVTKDCRPDRSNHNSMMASSQGIIRGLSAEKEMLKIINTIPGALIDKTYQFQETSVEIDAIIVKDDGIYLIELKNYKADKIVIEASGVAYRIHGNKEYRIDNLLEQVGRARDIVRGIVHDIAGDNVNIYNVIAFADEETKIINKLESDNLMFFDLRYLPFVFQNKKSSEPVNDQIIEKLLSTEIPERKHEFYDIFAFKNEVIDALKHDLAIYNNWYDYHEKALDEIQTYRKNIEDELSEMIHQSKLSLDLRNYLVEASQKIINNYFNKREESILKNLDIHVEEIDGEISKLDAAINKLTL